MNFIHPSFSGELLVVMERMHQFLNGPQVSMVQQKADIVGVCVIYRMIF